MKEESYLKRKTKDFKNKEETPEELIRDDDTLGAVMTDSQLLDWLEETRKVFTILQEENKATFKRLYDEYVLDINYLLELKRIDKESAESLKEIERFKF